MRAKVRKISLCVGILLSILLLTGCFSFSAEKVTLHMMSHRYPALEFYGKALSDEAPPNVEVISEYMPFPKWLEKMRVNLAAGSSTYDITYAPTESIGEFAKNGWLLPLDDFIKKYEDEFHFSDIPESVWKAMRYEGKTYLIPHHITAYIFFYRNDIFTKAGLQVPATLEEYVKTAAKLTTPERYGTSLTFMTPTPLFNEFHSYLNGCGGWFFDKDLNLTIQEPEGVMAVTYMKRLMEYAPPGVMNYGNDESSVAMQQDRVAMMNQWSTRAAPMDNPEKSKVVGLVKWDRPCSLWKGGPPVSRTVAAGFAIPAFTKNDPDLIFRVIARATDEETVQRGSKYANPVRLSVANDPKLSKLYPDWEATAKAMAAGSRDRPALAEFQILTDVIARRVAQALTGEKGIKEALDLAAQESYKILEDAGYYK